MPQQLHLTTAPSLLTIRIVRHSATMRSVTLRLAALLVRAAVEFRVGVAEFHGDVPGFLVVEALCAHARECLHEGGFTVSDVTDDTNVAAMEAQATSQERGLDITSKGDQWTSHARNGADCVW